MIGPEIKFITVKVHAGAKREAFEQTGEYSFTISVREKAARNQANKKVIELLGKELEREINTLRIINGHHRPNKLIQLI